MKLKQFFLYGMIFFSTIKLPLIGLDQYPSNKEASFYHYNSQQQWNVAYEALKTIIFKGDEQILDIGCGSGKITANLAGRVSTGSILGLDLSHGMIEFAQKTYAPFYSNLSFIESDILEFNSTSQFDLIFSASSLHWVSDQQFLLTKVYDLLKDKGTILFTIPCSPSLEITAIFQDIASQSTWKDYLKNLPQPRHKFNSEEYFLLLEQTGFHAIEVTQVPFTYFFETKREFADWFAAFSPMLFSIPKEMHEMFLMSLVDRYLETFPLDEMGRIIFKQNELIIKAQK